MKTNLLISAAALIVTALSSCEKNSSCLKGIGGYTTHEYTIEEFDRLEISGTADVYIVNDEQTTLRIEGQENVLNELNVEVINSSLKIGDDNCFKDIKKLQIYVSTPLLNGVFTLGDCNVYSEDTFSTSVFDASISGTGSMELKLDVDEFNTNISGDAQIKAVGNALTQDYNISGIGKYYCFDLLGENVGIDISGIGTLEVNASNKLNVNISGSGNIKYKGNPEIKQDISGSGNINSAN